MKRRTLLALIGAALTPAAQAMAAALRPPTTPKRPVRIEQLGRVRTDDYAWLKPKNWLGPALLALALLGELIFCITAIPHAASSAVTITPKQVGTLLFGSYWIGVELASLLLMAGLVGAFHLGRHALAGEDKQHVTGTDTARLDSRSDLVHAGARGTSHAA